MATFTVFLEDKQLLELKFDRGPLVIGRARDADILIAHLSVSRRHALVQKVGRGWTVENVSEKNELLLNGTVVTTHALKHGDRVGLGEATVIFRNPRVRQTSGSAPLFKPGDEEDETLDVTNPRAAPIAAPVEVTGRRKLAALLASPHIAFTVDGERQMLPVRETALVLGRGPNADVQVSDSLLGPKRVATIRVDGADIVLTRVSRLAHISVNGILVGETVRLRHGDKVRVGERNLIFRAGR